MTVCAGSRVGPYEILALLGAGGMGEVYRASDTRLGREVAIKVPPAGFAADPERLRRFEQEARAIAFALRALSQPEAAAGATAPGWGSPLEGRPSIAVLQHPLPHGLG